MDLRMASHVRTRTTAALEETNTVLWGNEWYNLVAERKASCSVRTRMVLHPKAFQIFCGVLPTSSPCKT